MEAKIEYPTVPSALWSIQHGKNLPLPKPQSKWDNSLYCHDENSEDDILDPEASGTASNMRVTVSHILLNRDHGLSRKKAWLFFSWLQDVESVS